jgi:beta-alanine--pyruvate transaminase
MEPVWYDAAMTLKGVPRVLDIRCVGLTAGIDVRRGPTRRQARLRGDGARLPRRGIMFRIVGDSIAVTPPLIVSESQIGEIFEKVGKVIKALA